MPKLRLLIIDDEALMREYVAEAMERAGYAVETVESGKAGIDAFEKASFSAVITDLKMAPMSGLQVLEAIRERDAEAAVVVMTAYGTIETAVEALKAGAADYLLKPFSPDAIEVAVARAIERARLARENRMLREELERPYQTAAILGESPAMQVVHEQIRRVADTRATVLIRGESGTGKELVAHAIHSNSDRSAEAFVKVNCAALSAGILESELFGHERGAFTGAHERRTGRFELADRGTLLLDEISEMGIDLQPKLLRALQEREIERVGGAQPIPVDTRILATSNRDLEKAVREGQFREDLFFRINVVAIEVPPLRERREDIPLLLDHYLERFAREYGRAVDGYSTDAKRAALAYGWPGNVRELRHAVERAVILSETPVLEAKQLRLDVEARLRAEAPDAIRAGSTVAEMEKHLIVATLAHCNDHRAKAADMLGISVRTLRNKLAEYRGEEVSDADAG